MLSGELSTHLTGRYVDFNLFPFSFREFLDYKGFKIEKDTFYSVSEIAQIKSFLEEYIKIGLRRLSIRETHNGEPLHPPKKNFRRRRTHNSAQLRLGV